MANYFLRSYLASDIFRKLSIDHKELTKDPDVLRYSPPSTGGNIGSISINSRKELPGELQNLLVKLGFENLDKSRITLMTEIEEEQA
jgi:hypothetical protein